MQRIRRFCLAVLAAAFVVGCWASGVRVLDWNFKRAVGSNGPNTSQQPYVAKIVNYINPDVWLIHELGGNNSGYSASAEQAALVSFINSNLTIYGSSPQLNVNYYVYVDTRTDGYIGSALVSKYPFKSTPTDVYIGAPGRGWIVAWVNVTGTNGVGFQSGHFKSAGGASGALERQTNAEGARDNGISWLSSHTNSALVVGGDLNETEDSDQSPVYPLGTILSNGHAYFPISTVRAIPVNDLKPLDALNNERTWNVTSPSIRFDYLMTSQNNGTRDNVVVTTSYLFNTRHFQSGQLPPGFLVSDSDSASDHVAVVANLDVSPPSTTVSGNVSLDLYSGGAGIGATLEMRSPGTTNVLFSAPITLDGSGNYIATNCPTGTFDLAVKFPNWLRQVLSSVSVVYPSTAANFAESNGDSTNDNIVNLLDLSDVLSVFGTSVTPGDPGDLNWDGTVSLFDLSAVLSNFGLQGSP